MIEPKLYRAVWRDEDGAEEEALFVSQKTDKIELLHEAQEVFREDFNLGDDYKFSPGEVTCYYHPIDGATDYTGGKRYKIALIKE